VKQFILILLTITSIFNCSPKLHLPEAVKTAKSPDPAVNANKSKIVLRLQELDYLLPYFAEMHKLEHTETFIYYIHQHTGWNEVNRWLEINQSKVNLFRDWTSSFKWKFR